MYGKVSSGTSVTLYQHLMTTLFDSQHLNLAICNVTLSDLIIVDWFKITTYWLDPWVYNKKTEPRSLIEWSLISKYKQYTSNAASWKVKKTRQNVLSLRKTCVHCSCSNWFISDSFLMTEWYELSEHGL